jgi:hypothetical protein
MFILCLGYDFMALDGGADTRYKQTYKRRLKKKTAQPDGDQGTTSKDLVQVPIGPVTRA